MGILCIDIGNTNIACGFFSDGKWSHTWRLRTDPVKTSDEYLVLFHGLFLHREIHAGQIQGVCISSVVPELNDSFQTIFTVHFNVTPLFVSSKLNLGLRIEIDNPNELGPDLIANGVAGIERYSDSVIVVDFGTALTFTCVEKKPTHCAIRGVSIAPGLRSALGALSSNTAQLPHVSLEVPPKAIGTNTIHSIQSGIVLGYAGLVDSMITRLKKELSGPVHVIATGGLCSVLSNVSTGFTLVDPWLTLDGLRIIYEKNS